MKKTSLITLATIITTTIAAAQPAVEWIGGQTYNNAGRFTLGWRFRVSSASDIEVAALGAYDRNGDGLALPHDVAIWPVSGGAPLVTATVPAGTGSFLEGHFRYVNITPVRLFKDADYVIGAAVFGESEYGAFNVQGFTNSAGIVWVTNRFEEMTFTTNHLVFPTREDEHFGFGGFGPNFQYTAVPSIPYQTIRFSQVELCWTSETNKQYQVQYRSSLTTNAWQNLGSPVQGTGTNNCILDPIPRGEPQRYYQVLALP